MVNSPPRCSATGALSAAGASAAFAAIRDELDSVLLSLGFLAEQPNAPVRTIEEPRR